MSTNSSSADYGRFEALAEEFAARFRRGERPSLQEYIDRCPEWAEEIRELFPALVEVGHPVADGQETTVRRKPLSDLGFGRSLGQLVRLVEGRFGSISRTLGRY